MYLSLKTFTSAFKNFDHSKQQECEINKQVKADAFDHTAFIPFSDPTPKSSIGSRETSVGTR
jgi:hypothetical protein